MSDYKPKVGEEFLGTTTGSKYKALFIGSKTVFSKRIIDDCEVLVDFSYCAPIPSKAETELEILNKIVETELCHNFAKAVQKAGFTKSGEVEKVEWEKLVYCLADLSFRGCDSVEEWVKEWWKDEGQALLGHLIKNAPEDK